MRQGLGPQISTRIWDRYPSPPFSSGLVGFTLPAYLLLQISHIFSDKTGTLTQNKMVFRSCFIAGNSYGDGQVSFLSLFPFHFMTRVLIKSGFLFS